MGSKYHGETNLGNETRGGGSSSSSSSSRKGKKNNNSDHKPKQPQRGLGVAQLEKLRLHGHGQFPYDFPSHFNQEDMGFQRANYHPSMAPSSSFSYSSSSIESSASYGFHPNIMMGMADYDTPNMRYGDLPNPSPTSWSHGDSLLEAGTRPTRHLLDLQKEGTHEAKKNKNSNSMRSSSQNSESDDSHEVDLELRLSI